MKTSSLLKTTVGTAIILSLTYFSESRAFKPWKGFQHIVMG